MGVREFAEHQHECPTNYHIGFVVEPLNDLNTQKQTFVMVDAGQFLMGSTESEPGRDAQESQHFCRIGRRFAISAHEVTKAQYRPFQRAVRSVAFLEDNPQLQEIVRTDDSPQTAVAWYEAARYCNWLSEKEGIAKDQWCYEPNEEGRFADGMKAKEKFWELIGYRLPTEAEWEFACRAGTVTSRYYGLSERLLPQYAWFLTNGEKHAWPTASLQPNDLGLFDMLGNAEEWCFDRFADYSTQIRDIFEDRPSTMPVEAIDRRVVRGGAFSDEPGGVRSAHHLNYQPGYRLATIGFRPARTYP